MRTELHLPADLDGRLWRYAYAGQNIAPHHHTELEFNVVTRGTGTYLVDDRKYHLARRSLIWLFPRQEHVLLSRSTDFEMWIAVVKPQLVDRTCRDAAAAVLREPNPPGDFCRRLNEAATRRLVGLFAEVDSQLESIGRFNAGLAYALLSTWAEFHRADAVPAGNDVHPAVEKAAHFIQNSLGTGSEMTSLQRVAKQAGLSPARLSRVFRRETGMSLVEFRNRKRIERFIELYGAGQRSTMLNAALEAGFGSYPQFHRVFTRVMGCSPAAYRKSLA